MDGASLQERLAPTARCFGCGPANPDGLHLRSFEAGDGSLVAAWEAPTRFEAFDGALNGGIVSTLLDCHANWTAVMRLRDAFGEEEAPSCVTAELAVRYLAPTPTRRGPLRLVARVVQLDGRKATVEASIEAPDGTTTATARGTFVAVRPGHPAYDRWRA